jgi:hypothetical protein
MEQKMNQESSGAVSNTAQTSLKWLVDGQLSENDTLIAVREVLLQLSKLVKVKFFEKVP